MCLDSNILKANLEAYTVIQISYTCRAWWNSWHWSLDYELGPAAPHAVPCSHIHIFDASSSRFAEVCLPMFITFGPKRCFFPLQIMITLRFRQTDNVINASCLRLVGFLTSCQPHRVPSGQCFTKQSQSGFLTSCQPHRVPKKSLSKAHSTGLCKLNYSKMLPCTSMAGRFVLKIGTVLF